MSSNQLPHSQSCAAQQSTRNSLVEKAIVPVIQRTRRSSLELPLPDTSRLPNFSRWRRGRTRPWRRFLPTVKQCLESARRCRRTMRKPDLRRSHLAGKQWAMRSEAAAGGAPPCLKGRQLRWALQPPGTLARPRPVRRRQLLL